MVVWGGVFFAFRHVIGSLFVRNAAVAQVNLSLPACSHACPGQASGVRAMQAGTASCISVVSGIAHWHQMPHDEVWLRCIALLECYQNGQKSAVK